MRAPPSLLFSLSLLLSLISASDVLNLSKFQEIAGFSFSCTDAYKSPLSGCTTDDFTNGAACSQSCITQLELVTGLINTACKGTKAYPNTLIGMFFTGRGVSTLCPNADSSTTSAAPGVGGGQISSTTVSPSSSPPQTTLDVPTATSTIPASPSNSASSTTTLPSKTSTTSSTPSTSPSSNTSPPTTPSSTSTTQPLALSTTVLPTLSTTTSQSNPATLTPLPASSTSSSTSGTHTTATGGGDKGAVGPILGVTSSSSRNSKSLGLIVASLVGVVSFALLV